MGSSEGMRLGTSSDIKCFRCLDTSHHQYECVKEPVCYKCKSKGHMAIDCKDNSKKLKMFGFGIPGQGFYSFNLPESRGKVNQITGILTVIEGEASEEKVDKELKNLVRENWDFKVRKMDEKEFIVVFPDKTSLDTFTKLSSFGMPLYGLTGQLEKSGINHETSFVLQTVWIKIHDVPDVARDVEIVEEITSLVAEPLVVDELSLIRAELVRVQGRCRNLATLGGSIEFFFNGVGVFLRFEVEEGKSAGKGGKGGPPPLGHGHGPGGSGGGNNGQDKQYKGGSSKKGPSKFDRFGKIDKGILVMNILWKMLWRLIPLQHFTLT